MAHLASFLNHRSLLMLSLTNYRIHQSIRPVVGNRCEYQANRDFMLYGLIPLRLRVFIQHAYISVDWLRFGGTPLSSFVHCMKERGHAGEALRSVHIERFELISSDVALLSFAPNLRLIVFGRQPSPMHELKTMAMQSNTNLRESASLFNGIERIVVGFFGAVTPEFRLSLNTVMENNLETLQEIEVGNIFEDGLPFEINPQLKLRSLITNASISSFFTEMNVSKLNHLECNLSNEEPILKTALNLRSFKINLCVEEWGIAHIRKVMNFFPNLVHLDIKSSYAQTPILDEEKITTPNLISMKCQYFGVIIMTKFIATNLLHVEMTPLSRALNVHLAAHSRKLITVRGRDNLLSDNKIETIKEYLISHPRLSTLSLQHNSLTCACDLLNFVMELKPFIFMRARHVNIEFFLMLMEHTSIG